MAIDKPTLAQHAEIAHDIRSAEIALGKVLEHGRFFYKAEDVKLIRAKENALGLLKSRLEDVMLATYSHLSNDWLSLYYGDHADIERLARSLDAGMAGGETVGAAQAITARPRDAQSAERSPHAALTALRRGHGRRYGAGDKG